MVPGARSLRALVAATALLLVWAAPAGAGTISPVSDVTAPGGVTLAGMSADGRFVAYHGSHVTPSGTLSNLTVRDRETGATLLLQNDVDSYVGRVSFSADGRYFAVQVHRPGVPDFFFVKDRVTGTEYYPGVPVCSIPNGGGTPTCDSGPAGFSLSGDGRYLAYSICLASRHPAGCDVGGHEVFVWDRQTGGTERITSGGESTNPSISADGRFVAFESNPGDPLGSFAGSVVVYDRHTHVSQTVTGLGEDSGYSYFAPSGPPAISADGRFVAFKEFLHGYGVFVRDRTLGTTVRLTGEPDGDFGFGTPTISADGRFVAFSDSFDLPFPPLEGVVVVDRVTKAEIDQGLSCNLPHLVGPPCDISGPAISADGRTVAFGIDSPLVTADTNGVGDVYVSDAEWPRATATGSFSTYGVTDSRQAVVPAGANRVLMFVFAGKVGGDSLGSVTYGGRPLTLLAARDQRSVHLEVRYLLDPPVGTAALGWSKSGVRQNVTWGYTVYSGVDQSLPFGTPALAGQTGDGPGAKSVTATAATNDLVVDGFVANGDLVVGSGPSAGDGQAQRWSARISTTEGGSSERVAPTSPAFGGPVTTSWTPPPGAGSSLDWALIAVPLHPALGLLPSTTHTQSSTTASDVPPGTAVTDTATVTGSGPTPTRFVDFFLCDPATVAANGGDCRAGGVLWSGSEPLDGTGRATSTAASPTAPGTYCWRAEYTGDGNYLPSKETGAANECFTISSGHAEFAAGGSFSTYGVADSRPVVVPDVSDRVLVFVFAGKVGGDALGSVTYGGRPLALLAARDQRSVHLEIRYLLDPPAGTAALAWSKSGASQNVTWGYSVYTGVDQSVPFGVPVAAGQTGDGPGAKSVSVTAATGDLVVDGFVANGDLAVGPGPSAGAGQSQRWSARISTTEGGSSDRTGGSPTTMSWTPPPGAGNSFDWALIAFAVHAKP